MALVWVQLRHKQRLEVQGRQVEHEAGDWVEVGKQLAREWEQAGIAFYPEQSEAPNGQRGDVAGLTFLTIPRTWADPYLRRQENAIGSWVRLDIPVKLIFFCDDPGTEEAARRWGARYVPRSGRNEWGTPVITDVFLKGQQMAQTDLVAYCNTDVILFPEFSDAVRLCQAEFKQFVMIGHRWDVNLETAIDYGDEGWPETIWNQVAREGRKHSQGAEDYFVFPKGVYTEVPPFAVGRSAWDNWLVCDAVQRDIDVIDVGEYVTVVHQDMPDKKRPPVTPTGKIRDPEKQRNWELYAARRGRLSGSANNAQWALTKDGFKRR